MKFSVRILVVLGLLVHVKSYPSEDFLDKLKEYIDNVHHKSTLTSKRLACVTSNDCLRGFFCKNNDCVARRKENDECMSMQDDECECNKCTSVSHSWKKICSNQKCPNSGKSKPLNFK